MTELQGSPIRHQGGMRILGGQPPSPEILAAWRQVLHLPEAARSGFWDLLTAAVLEPLDPSAGERIAAFATESGVQRDELLQALQICDLLLGGGATHDLAPEDLRGDLAVLSGGPMPLHDELARRYASVRPTLRARLVEAALADHGKVLIGIDWRVDNVTASGRGHIAATVVLMTLRYREGDEVGRVTLQMTPESIGALKAFADRFSG